MATPSEKMAQALEALKKLQEQGLTAIRSADLTRTNREKLVANGFLTEVMKGWYIPSKPGLSAGDSTAWYTSFWGFCGAYLHYRFGNDWCLSPEQSLSVHAGNRTVPTQLLIRAPKARNKITALPHDTSLLDVRSNMPEAMEIEEKEGLRLYSVTAALIACAPGFYTAKPTDARAALAMIHDASEILPQLLEGGHSTIAGRLVGGMRNIGRNRIADDVLKTMRTAGYDVRERDPFDTTMAKVLSARETSPYANRIRLMWQQMRGTVIELFPRSLGQPIIVEDYLKSVEEIYATDAYHSLSIEGYRVSPELINRVRDGEWNPSTDDADREQCDALAVRGYWQAYQAVRESIRKVLRGGNPGDIADEDHGAWYREMFAPSVAAALLRSVDLAGYRNDQVYLRGSMHVPPSREAVRELMPTFFDLLREEEDSAVRVVLGHFVFVYIHPYMDGNGRIGRFLMNLMFAAGGYPWTVVPVEERNVYMEALEAASVQQDIAPFASFLASLVVRGLEGNPNTKPSV